MHDEDSSCDSEVSVLLIELIQNKNDHTQTRAYFHTVIVAMWLIQIGSIQHMPEK